VPSRFNNLRRRAEALQKPAPVEVEVKSIDDLTSLTGYKPTARQREAHAAQELFVLYGGSVGSGKSVWLANSVIFHCLRYPKARAILARLYLSSLEKTTMLTLEEQLPLELVEKWNKVRHTITFKNGSTIFLVGLGDDQRALQKLLSMEISLWAIDQAEEVSERFFHLLNSRLRLKVPGLDKYRGIMTANPSPGWLRTRFVESVLPDHKFVQALPADNPFLPSDYLESLRRTLPPELIEAWVEGRWDAIASENAIFNYEEIQGAIKRSVERGGPLCYSVDPARFGGDETVIAKKAGNRITFEKILSKKDTMATSGEIVRAVGDDHAVPIKVDSIGIGAGVCDRLRELGYHVVEIVGSQAAKKYKTYRNRRAENYFRLKELLPELSLPNDPKLVAEMMSIRYRVLSDGLVLIESKEEIKKRGLASPDRLDAVVMACAGEAHISLEERERFLPRLFRRGVTEKIAEAAGMELAPLPEPDPPKSVHEARLRENGLTLEDEARMLKQGLWLPGITKRPPLPTESEEETFDAEMLRSGYSKIIGR
jgi:phage terminase large subunit